MIVTNLIELVFLQFSPLRGENWGSFEGETDFFRALARKKSVSPSSSPSRPSCGAAKGGNLQF